MMKRLKICLINPKFEPSYWGLDYALLLYPGNKQCTMTTGALPHLAGLIPDHEVYLLDENVEKIDFELLKGFDVVGLTGMIVQRDRMKSILLRLCEMKIFTVVGGAYASVNETFFEGLCDVVFSGEADETWPEFVDEFAAGRAYKKFYTQENRTIMTTLPKPRYDLLKVDRYASGSVQFSRGCPFQCEFCDIIVTFGRRPRTKHPEQVLEELEDMRKVGFFSCFIVDDNFIGDKKAAKALLRLIIPWQEKHGYPLRLTTEASINLADDAELLDLMYRANFRSVFIGIETPRVASLLETKKFQNTSNGSLEEKMGRIRNAGLDINGGFIVGFDQDDITIMEEQFRFIQDNGILLAMVGMLVAVPKTPLFERLEQEGRLRLDRPNCNFVPKLMTSGELQQGYWDLLTRLYSPQAFLDRYFRVFLLPEFNRKRAEICVKANEGKSIPTLVYGLILLWNLFRALSKDGSLRTVGIIYIRYFFGRSVGYRNDIVGFAQYMNRCATHWHFYKFTREGVAGRLRLFNSG
ncbi:MAG: DUF4070 domain-containing protein [Syntrophales bacterium]